MDRSESGTVDFSKDFPAVTVAPANVDKELVLLSDLAARAGRYGTQRFLSFFLKSPMHDYTEE